MTAAIIIPCKLLTSLDVISLCCITLLLAQKENRLLPKIYIVFDAYIGTLVLQYCTCFTVPVLSKKCLMYYLSWVALNL